MVEVTTGVVKLGAGGTMRCECRPLKQSTNAVDCPSAAIANLDGKWLCHEHAKEWSCNERLSESTAGCQPSLMERNAEMPLPQPPIQGDEA